MSIYGSLPSPQEPTDENLEGVPALDDQEKDKMLNDDLVASDWYGYGYGNSRYDAMEAMTCLTSVDAMAEECILSSPVRRPSSANAVGHHRHLPPTIHLPPRQPPTSATIRLGHRRRGGVD